MAHFNGNPEDESHSDSLLCFYPQERSSRLTPWRKQTLSWKNSFKLLSFSFPCGIFLSSSHFPPLYFSDRSIIFPSKFHLIRGVLDSLPAYSFFTQQRFSGCSQVLGIGDTVPSKAYVTLFDFPCLLSGIHHLFPNSSLCFQYF